ncbi:hypothetical protein [Kitasatospora kifunensis]|uniref:Uncharacterized protein n=1 Tax=Kitasatospora kifunensis TaxID=58351 RepID=A0A7W7VZS6_KITKI|nr:hypothetical protein [Kitasatospora kifunensis]MBB4928005.1 hypothetical protein [Kitasatospora kifunensis]
MVDPEVLERIVTRRAELDEVEEQLAKQLDQVRAERDELAVAERVLQRMTEQIADARATAAPETAQVGGRKVLLVPHRGECPDESALPGDYRRILSIVRAVGGPVQVRAVGEELGLEVEVRGKLEPLRAKLVKLADRGWLHKRPDGKFTARL